MVKEPDTIHHWKDGKSHPHDEATVLTFTEFHSDSGQEFNLTIRQGVTQEDIDKLLDNLVYLSEKGDEYGLYGASGERPSMRDKRQINKVREYRRNDK